MSSAVISSVLSSGHKHHVFLGEIVYLWTINLMLMVKRKRYRNFLFYLPPKTIKLFGFPIV